MTVRYASTVLLNPQHTGRNPSRVTIRPVLDLVENEAGVFLYCNMPGVPGDALIVHLENDMLHIRGVTNYGPLPAGRVHALEFDEAVYETTLAVPRSVDTRGMTASLRNGVLTVFFPYPAPKAPRRIPVTVA